MFQRWLSYFFAALAVIGNCQEEGATGPDDIGTMDHEEGFDSEINSESLRKIHSKMDADKDGNLSYSEMVEFAYKMENSWVERSMSDQSFLSDNIGMHDTNKDGKLHVQELQSADASPAQHARFRAADRNADDILEGDEVGFFVSPALHDEVLTMVATATMKRKDKDANGKLTRLELSEGETNPISEDDIDFSHADRDRDGALNLQELKSYEAGYHHEEFYIHTLFDAADKDKNKLLTFAELEAEYFKDQEAGGEHSTFLSLYHHAEL